MTRRADSRPNEVIDILNGMPDWTSFSLNEENVLERERIETCMRRIAAYDLDTIRTAVQLYHQESALAARETGRSSTGKLFLLNKFLFDLPEAVRRDSPHFRMFGGWLGLPVSGDPHVPHDSDEMSLRWPWSEDASGHWRLTGHFGGLMGPPYDALAVFDYYSREFGKRTTHE